ncbi:hypothetical protein SMD27_07325 [Dongia soli]|uniref:Uncharacterized protein n=1 Tax=Dongia soli TaxID=600628 RepID=A0ABU5E8P7_9PROT|nr:hypothetical protein [Dongia soli]MDY0882647.1 hypothetical protein [Dongia soli]
MGKMTQICRIGPQALHIRSAMSNQLAHRAGDFRRLIGRQPSVDIKQSSDPAHPILPMPLGFPQQELGHNRQLTMNFGFAAELAYLAGDVPDARKLWSDS